MTKKPKSTSPALPAPFRQSAKVARAFPDGSMTKSGRRREAARGRLAMQRIGGKHKMRE
jgi:hypothetical protein